MNNQHDQNKFEDLIPPDNYLVWAILSTLLCCMPLGIVSIVKSASVNTLWAQGKYDEARIASDQAFKFAKYSAISAFAIVVIYLIFILFAGVGSVLMR